MSLKFYAGSGSPFVWKVWLALEHKQVPYELHMLSFDAGDLRAPAYASVNPRLKVPAIVHDGFALYESQAIVEYVEETFAGPPIWPGSHHDRAFARRLAAESDAYFSTAVRALANRLVEGGESADRDARGAVRGIEPELRAVEAELAWLEDVLRGEHAAGTLSGADFAMYPVAALVRRLELRYPGRGIARALGTRSRTWMATLEALPYLAKTVPPHWG